MHIEYYKVNTEEKHLVRIPLLVTNSASLGTSELKFHDECERVKIQHAVI